MHHNRRIAFVCKSVFQYRRRFFELLRDELRGSGIALELVQGHAPIRDRAESDAVDIPWARHVPTRSIRIRGHELLWQPCMRLTSETELVIVEQASKLLANYLLQSRYLLGGPKLALWGHGQNFQQTSASRIGEWIKRRISTRVHWWFAYSNGSAAVVEQLGFQRERITVVQNAIDSRSLQERRRHVTANELDALRSKLGLIGRNTAIYVGAMNEHKRIGFLLEACNAIRASVPDFEMIFIGGGPDASLVRTAAAMSPWMKFVGSVYNDERVPYFLLSKIFLLPGAVGLGIIDSFALETPLVTTDVPTHGPEIEYLRSGANGLMLGGETTPLEYARTVVELLRCENVRQRLVAGCRAAQDAYTIEGMVHRFVDGIGRALESPRGFGREIQRARARVIGEIPPPLR